MFIKNLINTTLACLLLALVSSCTDDEPSTQLVTIKLTDAPGDYEEVNIDIKEIYVNLGDESDESGWYQLSGVNQGIYDLIELSNGIDTTLVTERIPAGDISQVRLVLGNDNSVQIDGIEYALKTPSAQQSGLKINLNETFEEGIPYIIVLDFDAARSVVETGNGSYNLKPVIRATAEASGGAIAGNVQPEEANAIVYAILGQDTVTSTPVNDSGDFLLPYLPAGNYTVGIDPIEDYEEASISNLTVTDGNLTEADTVFLDFIQ
ncbi:DUF4382 domain-containing protein [Marinigracilibium pacificum]|uniref:DUF4382 domain-containing protein n=1 Tax=Marinigracilibium pacificum TaxID=2729599 RepID=A0A848IZ67_9BACT|nr:DUF4382 domain-containing protein [Marinigracilibium pacificum]NMM48438.1 DUF4382 domain-containing protein [Marinigracilibium pacificum]